MLSHAYILVSVSIIANGMVGCVLFKLDWKIGYFEYLMTLTIGMTINFVPRYFGISNWIPVFYVIEIGEEGIRIMSRMQLCLFIIDNCFNIFDGCNIKSCIYCFAALVSLLKSTMWNVMTNSFTNLLNLTLSIPRYFWRELNEMLLFLYHIL